MQFAYPCKLTPDEEEGAGFVVTFPDVPEAVTGARTREDSLYLAEDALAVALAAYVENREEIPVPSPVADGQEVVAVPPIVAAKLALYMAMRRQRITRVALAARLGLSESAVRKLLDPDHRSHISQVEKALRAVGRYLLIHDGAYNFRAGKSGPLPASARDRIPHRSRPPEVAEPAR